TFVSKSIAARSNRSGCPHAKTAEVAKGRRSTARAKQDKTEYPTVRTINCAIEGAGQGRIKYAFNTDRECCRDPAIRVGDGRDSGIGRAHERQPLLDGAQSRLGEMLARSGRVAEPGVVGDVQNEPRTR